MADERDAQFASGLTRMSDDEVRQQMEPSVQPVPFLRAMAVTELEKRRQKRTGSLLRPKFSLGRIVVSFLDEIVDEEDRSRLDVFFEFAKSLFSESEDLVTIGFHEQRPEAEIIDKIVSLWQGAFALEDHQLIMARRLARSFYAEAMEILRDNESRSVEDMLVLIDEITARQVEHELRFLPILTASQRERLREALPVVIIFQRGVRDQTTEHRSSFF